jgi:WXXGXW repeat (2 copies)
MTKLAGFLLVATVGCVVPTSGHVHVAGPVIVAEAPPPAPLQPTVVVRPGFVWIDGHHVHRHGHYVWVAGRYEAERVGHRWIQGRWERNGNGHVWVEGHWESRR